MRRAVAILLALLAVLVTTTAVAVVWGRNQVLDTDRYLTTVTPLAEDPVIQDELAVKVADAISARIEAAAPRLPNVRSVVGEQARRFMRSDAFVGMWVTLNERGHRQLVTVLTDEDGTIQLDLDEIVVAVRQLVAEAGLRIVTTLPPITLVVDVAEVDGIESARSAVRLLDRVANLLPALALILLAGAIASSRRRLRAGALLGAGIAVLSVGALGVLLLGSHVAARRVPRSVASDDAVHAYYGHLTALLRNGYVTLAVAAVVAAVVCASLGRWRSGSRDHSGPAT